MAIPMSLYAVRLFVRSFVQPFEARDRVPSPSSRSYSEWSMRGFAARLRPSIACYSSTGSPQEQRMTARVRPPFPSSASSVLPNSLPSSLAFPLHLYFGHA
jgi:hypothetical protein